MNVRCICLVLLVCGGGVHGRCFTPSFLSKKKDSGACLKKPDPGSCKAIIPKWYYDQMVSGCKLFIYGGCNGNNNQFASELKCLEYCQPKMKKIPVCSLKPKPRQCESKVKYWHFNSTENTCHRLEAGLCPTSGNMFSSCEKCMKRCSGRNPLLPCSQEYKKLHNTSNSGRLTPTLGRPVIKPVPSEPNFGHPTPIPQIGRPTGGEWETTRL
ncbi:tissue factor pathway inhibitor 2-like [Dermacentor silvarum]|uniref:tissue factor pathway inhibitor 2-like n=1 Tax=Dermacentor silvarum TaxID=543639 RepID=UPI002101773B|nr:tissue factor pathway inhibitor 2-like [Dermacentor silvarum]